LPETCKFIILIIKRLTGECSVLKLKQLFFQKSDEKYFWGRIPRPPFSGGYARECRFLVGYKGVKGVLRGEKSQVLQLCSTCLMKLLKLVFS
jgi:hypothetical protein